MNMDRINVLGVGISALNMDLAAQAILEAGNCAAHDALYVRRQLRLRRYIVKSKRGLRQPLL